MYARLSAFIAVRSACKSVTSPVLSCACACGAAIATAKTRTAATSGCTARLPKLRSFVCTLAPCYWVTLSSPEYIHAGERVGELRFEAVPAREIRQRPIGGELRSVTRREIGQIG